MLKVKLSRGGVAFREMRYPIAMGVEAVRKAAELVVVAEAFNEDHEVNITLTGPTAVMRAAIAELDDGWTAAER